MRSSILAAAAALSLLAAPAFAASNSAIANIKTGGVNLPNCVQFWTADADGVTYTVSKRDTSWDLIRGLLLLSNATTLPSSGVPALPLIFVTTPVSDGPDFHPADCIYNGVPQGTYTRSFSEGQ